MSDTGKRQRKLRNFLIRPGLQIKFSMRIALAALSLSCLNILFFYIYMSENYSIFVDPSNQNSKYQTPTMEILQDELVKISILLFIISLVFVGVSFLTGIILSHQIAGPMVAFKRTFTNIKNGKLSSRINLRPSDEFQDVASDFNELMDDLEVLIDPTLNEKLKLESEKLDKLDKLEELSEGKNSSDKAA